MSTASAASPFRPATGRRGDLFLHLLTALALFIGLLLLCMVPARIVQEALPFFRQSEGLHAFLWRDRWIPMAEPPQLGILHAWVSTLYITATALLVAIPFGFGVGIFASEIAPGPVRTLLQPCMELLAGIPSVVYGFFGSVTLIPLFERWWDMPAGESVLAAGIIVGVMVLPYIASTSAEAFRAASGPLREAALALGISRAHMIRRIVLRRAWPGLFAAVALGFARAVGETLAVMLLAGNSLRVPERPLDRAQTLTALITTELGESPLGTPEYHSLFAAGAVLMVVVLLVNAAIWRIKTLVLAHG